MALKWVVVVAVQCGPNAPRLPEMALERIVIRRRHGPKALGHQTTLSLNATLRTFVLDPEALYYFVIIL